MPSRYSKALPPTPKSSVYRSNTSIVESEHELFDSPRSITPPSLPPQAYVPSLSKPRRPSTHGRRTSSTPPRSSFARSVELADTRPSRASGPSHPTPSAPQPSWAGRRLFNLRKPPPPVEEEDIRPSASAQPTYPASAEGSHPISQPVRLGSAPRQFFQSEQRRTSPPNGQSPTGLKRSAGRSRSSSFPVQSPGVASSQSHSPSYPTHQSRRPIPTIRTSPPTREPTLFAGSPIVESAEPNDSIRGPEVLSVPEGVKRPLRPLVRFKLAGLVVRSAQRMSKGTAALARRASLGSTASPGGSTTKSKPSQNIHTPVDVTALHAGPGGIFEPDLNHPIRDILRQQLAQAPALYTDDEETSSSSPESSSSPPNRESPRTTTPPTTRARKSQRRSVRQRAPPRRRARPPPPAPIEPPDEYISDPEPEPVLMADPARYPSSSSPSPVDGGILATHFRNRNNPIPLAQLASSDPPTSRFVRNVNGLEVYQTEPSSPLPLHGREPTTPLGRFVRSVRDLPWRSRTHVTVSYIPASAKPNGETTPDPWYHSRQARRLKGTSKEKKNRTPKVTMSVASDVRSSGSGYARGSRYEIHQHVVPNLPIEIYSADAPPVIIAPLVTTAPSAPQTPLVGPGAPQAWFSPAQGEEDVDVVRIGT